MLTGGGQVNPYIKTTNCGVDNQPIAYLGNVKVVTSGGLAMPSGIATWGGDVGVQPTVEVDYYYSGNVSGVYVNRERFYFVKGWGWVSWDHATLQTGVYVVDQGSTNNLKVSGGAPTPNFACKIPNLNTLSLAGTLPPGVTAVSSPQMNLRSDTGVISGTPTLAGTYPFIVQQEDAGGAFHLQNQTIHVAATAGQAVQTVLCLSAGTATVTATNGSFNNGVTVTCQTPAPTLSSITLAPLTPTVSVSSSIGLTATGHYSDSSTQNLTAPPTTWTSSNTAVAIISVQSNPQQVLCVSAGTSTITATNGATSGNTVVTCQTPTPPSVGNDAYCGPGNVVLGAATDSYATLPATCFYTNPSAFTSGGTVRHVSNSVQFASAVAATACGDVIQIDVSFAMTEGLLPSLHCTAGTTVTIQGFGFASLPAYGSRVTPCYNGIASIPGYPPFNCVSTTNVMPTITSSASTGTGAAFKVPAGGFSFLIIKGIKFTRAAGGLVTDLALDTTQGGQYDHLILEHNWFAGTNADETNRVMVFNRCNFCAVLDNFASELHCISVAGACSDAKFIGDGTNSHAGDTDHAHKIVNNFAASAAQCTLSGGAAAVLTPSDIEVRNNWCFKPLTWDPASAQYNGGVGGHAFQVKNCLELKNANRVLYEGNVCENGWAGFSQVGNAITITPKDQSPNLCPVCFVTNVTARYNWVKSYAQIMQIANVSDGGGNYAVGGNSYSFHDNLGEDMQDPTICYLCQSSAAMMTLFNAIGAPANDILHSVDVNHNTEVIAANTTKAVYSSYIMGTDAAVAPNNNAPVKWQNNIFPLGFFGGVHSSGGGTSSCAAGKSDAAGIINSCFFPGGVASGNTILPPLLGVGGSPKPTWPAGNCTTETSYTSIFMNYNNGLGGDYRIKPTSPCHASGNDGKDPGADIPTLLNRIQNVTSF